MPADPAAASATSGAGTRAPRRPLRFIRWILLAGLVVLGAAILYALVEGGRAVARPLAVVEAAEGVAQRALNLVTTRTRRGLPSLQVTAKEAITYREGSTELRDVHVTVFGSREDRFEVVAPLAISGEGGAGGWTFREGVEILGEDGLRLRVPELRYRETPQEVSADGAVEFERGSLVGNARGLRYLVARRRLDFLSEVDLRTGDPGGTLARIRAGNAVLDESASRITFGGYAAEGGRGERLEGSRLEVLLTAAPERRPIRYLASGGFTARDPAGAGAAGPLPGGERTLAGDALAVDLTQDGRPARAVATGNVVTSRRDAGAEKERLESGRLEISFEGGRAVSLAATENAALHLAPEPGATGEALVRARSLSAALDPGTGTARSATATGEAVASEPGRRLAAETIAWDAAGGDWVLDGAEGAPARVEAEGSVIAARHMEIRRSSQTLSAHGGVKTTTMPSARAPAGGDGSGAPADAPARAPAGLFGEEAGPVHAVADSLVLTRPGRVARYKDKVRIWQGAGSLEAASVDVMEEAQSVEARGGVVARIPAKRREGGAGQAVTVSAAELHYARESGAARFTGKVRAVTGTMRVEADTITTQSDAGGGGVRSFVAEGSVRVIDGRRVGTCDRLTAELREERYVLSGKGRLAVIQDQASQQVVRGTVLTYEGVSDRILVESETGGRTWVTLKPRAGEKASDPEPPR